MDFILNEAFEDEFIEFSDSTTEEENSEDESDSFVENDVEDGEQEPSFYRSIDNKNERVKFFIQKFETDSEKIDEDYYGDDDQPELFNPEKSEKIEFDSFEKSQDLSAAFKKVF